MDTRWQHLAVFFFWQVHSSQPSRFCAERGQTCPTDTCAACSGWTSQPPSSRSSPPSSWWAGSWAYFGEWTWSFLQVSMSGFCINNPPTRAICGFANPRLTELHLTCVVSVNEHSRMLWDVGYIVQVHSHIFLVPDDTISAFQGCRRCQNPLNNDY